MSSDIDNTHFVNQFAKSGATKDEGKMKEFFQRFDHNKDNKLDRNEFRTMLLALVEGDVSAVDKALDYIFTTLDRNSDGFIDEKEFRDVWFLWIQQILDPVSALIIVDVQNDFISGSLSLCNCPSKDNGAEVVPVINSILTNNRPDYVVYTLDWHPPDHISFVDNVHKRKLHSKSKVGSE